MRTEAQVLSKRAIDVAERVGIEDLLQLLDRGTLAMGQERRRPLAGAVDRKNRRFLEVGAEESAGGVRKVVLDEVEPRPFSPPQAHRFAKRLVGTLELHPRRPALLEKAGRVAKVPQGVPYATPEPQPGPIEERHMVELAGFDARFFQAVTNRRARQVTDVLTTRETLFGDRRPHPPVLDERGGCVVHIAVETEDVQETVSVQASR